MKYIIQTTSGPLDISTGHGAEPCSIKEPKWASGFEFFTHENPGTMYEEYNLTEASTGFAIIARAKTRKSAVRLASAKLKKHGRAKFLRLVLDNQLPK